LKPLTPDFSKPVPDAKTELLKLQIEHQQRIIDDLRRNCGEYRKIIKLLQTCQIPKPAEKR
jgi:hypothetical protein